MNKKSTGVIATAVIVIGLLGFGATGCGLDVTSSIGETPPDSSEQSTESIVPATGDGSLDR